MGLRHGTLLETQSMVRSGQDQSVLQNSAQTGLNSTWARATRRSTPSVSFQPAAPHRSYDRLRPFARTPCRAQPGLTAQTERTTPAPGPARHASRASSLLPLELRRPARPASQAGPAWGATGRQSARQARIPWQVPRHALRAAGPASTPQPLENPSSFLARASPAPSTLAHQQEAPTSPTVRAPPASLGRRVGRAPPAPPARTRPTRAPPPRAHRAR